MKKIFIRGEEEKMINYAGALRGCGAQPVFSLNAEDSAGCDGLLLPGGADMDPALYGQENTASAGIDRERDEAELKLVHLFLESGRPILGICKGMQVINVALGGTLIQNVENTDVHKWDQVIGDRVHEITAGEGCFLRELYGERFYVNSAHHQALDQIGKNLTVTARADDGTPEALEWKEKKLYAVQWHPERMAFLKRREDTVDGQAVFEFFLNLL